MTVNLILFLVLAAACIATALGMLVSRSAIYSALFLVLNFGTVAIFYIILNAPFIAMSQITVYAGAIMVLFIFVIMLLGTDVLPQPQALPWQRPAAIVLAALLIVEAGYLVFFGSATGPTIPQAVESFGSPQDIGGALFNQYLLPFEVTSVLLLIAMVGAIILTQKDKGGR
ncbi:MAG TPA: NADH-quinone oxidoreductase subunit J [Anaerolineales bacterium]|nr:NADH-quinone oxidoreductase subunit J [Anaerolineales bacterium]